MMRPRLVNLGKQRFHQQRRVPTHRPLLPGMAHCAERAGLVQGENRTQRTISVAAASRPHMRLRPPEGGPRTNCSGRHRLHNLTFGSMHDRLECNVPKGHGQEQRAQSFPVSFAEPTLCPCEAARPHPLNHTVSGQWWRRVLVVDGFPELEARCVSRTHEARVRLLTRFTELVRDTMWDAHCSSSSEHDD